MIMFYLDYLYGVLVNNLQNLSNFFKKNKKKKKKDKRFKTFEADAKYYMGLQLVCRGLVRQFLIFGTKSVINTLPADAEFSRFRARFKEFDVLQIP